MIILELYYYVIVSFIYYDDFRIILLCYNHLYDNSRICYITLVGQFQYP